MSGYTVKIGFWLRAYDGFTVNADSDGEAIEKAKTAAISAMESNAPPEHLDIEERREGVILIVDRETLEGRIGVIENVEFDDDRIHQLNREPDLGQPDQTLRRKADHFELILGILKILAYADDLQAPDLPLWLPRACAVIAKAEAILAGEPDPDPKTGGALDSVCVVRELGLSQVRAQIGAILQTDPDLSPLSADAVTDADIYDASIAAVAAMNLAKQIGAAEFRAALIAIGKAESRLANGAKRGPDHG